MSEPPLGRTSMLPRPAQRGWRAYSGRVKLTIAHLSEVDRSARRFDHAGRTCDPATGLSGLLMIPGGTHGGPGCRMQMRATARPTEALPAPADDHEAAPECAYRK